MRRFGTIGLMLLTLLASGPARAGSAEGEREPGSTVDMPYLIAPVVVDGTLFANAYVTSQIVATSAAATIVVRDKLPFIQDAFVRDVNAAPIGKPTDPSTVDVSALSGRLLADTRRIVGPSLIDSVHIVRVQMSLLHPKGAD